MLIKFAGQGGGGRGNDLLGMVHPPLNRIFNKDETMNIESDDLDYFSIIFRVAGEFHKFDNAEGCERIKKLRGKKGITSDFVIPEATWEKMSDDEFKLHVIEGVKVCFEKLKQKAKSLKWKFNEEKMNKDFESGVERFLREEL